MIAGHRVIFSSDTLFNAYEPKDHFSSGAPDLVAAETTPSQSSTTEAHYQQHVAMGGAGTKINLIACTALQNHSRGAKKEMSERQEQRGLGGWERAGMRT